MSAQACKIIIDMGVRALNEALERILTDPDLHQGKLPDSVRLDLIQRLADTDTASYTGNMSLMPEGGMAGIMAVLEQHGLVTDEVWAVYHRPEATPSSANGHAKPDKPKKDKDRDKGNGKGRGNGEGL